MHRPSSRRLVASVGIGCGVYTNTTSSELLGHGREGPDQPKVIFTSRQQTERIELVLDTTPPSELEEILEDSDSEDELRSLRRSPRMRLSHRIRTEEEIEQAKVAADLENRVLHPDPALDEWIKQTALAMAKTEEFQKHFQAQIQKNPPPVVLPGLPSASASSSTSGSSSSPLVSTASSSSSSAMRSAQPSFASACHEDENEGIIDRILNWLRVRLFGGTEDPSDHAEASTTANLEISVIVTLAAMMIVAFAFVRK